MSVQAALILMILAGISFGIQAQSIVPAVPVLKSISLLLQTPGSEKDNGLILHARLVGNGALYAYVRSAPEVNAQGSSRELALELYSSHTNKRDALGLVLSMNLEAGETQKWNTIPTLKLTFTDGSTFARTWSQQVLDSDGLALKVDGVRQMVELYAPQLMHPLNEPNLPANVEWFLPHTTMHFVNESCPKDNRDFGTSTIPMLQYGWITSACGGIVYTESGTRSAHKKTTFYLSDADEEARKGSRNAADWTTYYHAYPNDKGGWTIQYWTFYPYNTGRTIKAGPLPPIQIGFHGGDWEMIAVALDAQQVPVQIITTGHQDMIETAWSGVAKIETHPIVYTELGGHEVHTEVLPSASYIEHPTWPGSTVHGLASGDQPPGPLVDLGTRLAPAVPWLEYSGLWGSLGVLEISSGYWGPAFNETGMRADGFLTAWCSRIADPAEQNDFQRECYARDPR